MAFIDVAIFAEPATVTVDDYGDTWIRIRVGHGQIGLHQHEAVKLRDDLTRAITEAATAAAKAVEGAQA